MDVEKYREAHKKLEIAAKQKEEIVIVGDPQRIQYHKYRGNGDKRGRKILQHWSYARLSEQIIESSYLKGKTSEALKRSRKLAAIDELVRTIDDSGLEAWIRMEAHLLAGE